MLQLRCNERFTDDMDEWTSGDSQHKFWRRIILPLFSEQNQSHIKKKHTVLVCLLYLEGLKQASWPLGFVVAPQHDSGTVHCTQEQTKQTHEPKSTTLPFLRHCSGKKTQAPEFLLMICCAWMCANFKWSHLDYSLTSNNLIIYNIMLH